MRIDSSLESDWEFMPGTILALSRDMGNSFTSYSFAAKSYGEWLNQILLLFTRITATLLMVESCDRCQNSLRNSGTDPCGSGPFLSNLVLEE